MSAGFVSFGFGQNDDAVGEKVERFKGEKGRSYRVSFAWWPGLENGDLDMAAETPEFVGAQRNYLAGVGYFVNKGPEYTKLAGEPPRMAIGTAIIEWPLDRNGQIDKNAIANGDFKVKPWIMSQDKYNQLKFLHGQMHFGERDLAIQCTDSQYQKMTFVSCKDSLLAKIKAKSPEHFGKIVDRVAACVAAIQGEIGRDMTLDQIREKMTGGTTGGASAAPDPQTTAEIDDIVDNLLE